jgi:hypothetical protein
MLQKFHNTFKMHGRFAGLGNACRLDGTSAWYPLGALKR